MDKTEIFKRAYANPDQGAKALVGLEVAKTRFALRMRDARVGAGLTQLDLSNLTGISQPEISRIEKGRTSPTLGSLLVLCSALDVELDLVPSQLDR